MMVVVGGKYDRAAILCADNDAQFATQLSNLSAEKFCSLYALYPRCKRFEKVQIDTQVMRGYMIYQK
jgi:hypothetical protein